MGIGYILYNPLTGSGECESNVKALEHMLEGELKFLNVTNIASYATFLGGLEADDYVVIAGGDGTLNRFVNDTEGVCVAQDILYFPAGSGNDFARDMDKAPLCQPFSVKEILKDLPTVEVKGKKYRFINGVGYGIDGYCCQVGDEMRKTATKKINYAGTAIKGLLFHYKVRNCKITVDGKTYTYKNTWLAPTMLGRYYGGGMIPTPGQTRNDPDGKLSVMAFHGAARIPTLCVFPGIFKGEHVKHTKRIAVHSGYEITVEFDSPAPLQIDGETILEVSSYTARSAVLAAKAVEKEAATV